MARPQHDELRPIDDGPIDKPRPRPRPGGGTSGGGTGGGSGEPAPGHTLTPALKKKWRELGGLSWATPDDESGTMYLPGNRGRWAQFVARDGRLLQIIWTSATGAHEVSPPISDNWGRTGREQGALGVPTSDGLPTHDGAGRYQSFEYGVVVWHPTTGAFEVHGAIFSKYAERGGSVLGYPTTDETATPDGRGRFNHFYDPAHGGVKSIYWTETTGAWVVEGLIRGCWESLGWESYLGYPTSDEMPTHDGVGRYQTFEYGQIVWHPDTGAHAVVGTILAKYGELGGSAFGYPTTDETGTPNGRGRYNHFTDVATGAVKSIYWTADSGAHEVFGLFRNRWAELGWESSHLGFPIGPEREWPEGGPGSLQQAYQGGRMLMRGIDGATVEDPVAFGKNLGGGGGFGGNANMHLWSDGRIRWFGEVTNGSYQDYDYSIYAIVRTATVALAMRKSGQINMQVIGRNRNRWSEDATHAMTGAAFADLAGASFQLHDDHDGAVTSALSDVLGTLGAWAVTGALGPGLVGLIYAGIELGAVVTGGSWEAGPRIIAGSMWMLGPEGFLVGMAVDSLARIGTKSRGLLPDEKEFLRIVFGDTLDVDRITLTDTSGMSGRAFTFPSPMSDTDMNLNMADSYTKSSMLATNATLLAHEATHAWQYRYLANHSSYVVLGIFDSEYEPGAMGKKWHEYNIEQQGTIVEEWVRDHYTAGIPADDYGLSSPRALDDDRFRYIANNLRVGDGR